LQPRDQLLMAGGSIVDLQRGLGSADRHIEPSLADIDSSANNAIIAHLRRPNLAMRTSKFVQPSGSDEGSIAILLRNSPSDCGADDPTLDRPGPGGYPGRVIPRGTSTSLPEVFNTRSASSRVSKDEGHRRARGSRRRAGARLLTTRG